MLRTFVIFKQIGECAMNDDPVVSYINGTNYNAQQACNRLNDKKNGYYYYMELDDLKRHGFEV